MFDGYRTGIDVMWTPERWPGFEHLSLRDDGGRMMADGLVIAAPHGSPIRLAYQITCDDAWRTERLALQLNGQPSVVLDRSDDDRWHDQDGVEHNDLAGCVDVDIALTPFTNTLPIRRLRLEPGQAADLRMVYILPGRTLEITTSDQRYTRLEPGAGAEYRFQSGSFVADLGVDDNGIVIDYPGLWSRN